MIDFHTHIFPDDIAQKVIESLAAKSGSTYYTNGTCDGLVNSLADARIERAVTFSVATKAKQCGGINDFLSKLGEEHKQLEIFGAIHPDADNPIEILDDIKMRGFKGIKLHPAYQRTEVDDPKYMKIYEYAARSGLIVTVHGGLDIGFPGEHWCDPKAAKRVIEAVPGLKLVLAHMGGCFQWDEVKNVLAGMDVYFDTSYSFLPGKEGYLGNETFAELVRAHGADKILFGTDSPWTDHKKSIEDIRNTSLTEEEKQMIFHDNGARLLNL